MNSTFKKRLKKAIELLGEAYSELESINDDFESWMDEHDDEWESTKAGERAQDDAYEIESWKDSVDSLQMEIAEYIGLEFDRD